METTCLMNLNTCYGISVLFCWAPILLVMTELAVQTQAEMEHKQESSLSKAALGPGSCGTLYPCQVMSDILKFIYSLRRREKATKETIRESEKKRKRRKERARLESVLEPGTLSGSPCEWQGLGLPEPSLCSLRVCSRSKPWGRPQSSGSPPL